MSKVNISPPIKALWKGIGGHFDSFSEIMYEFIDNIISNYDRHNSLNKSAIIKIEPIDNNMLNVKIEDAGSGIINLQKSLTLAETDVQETALNEHGFGFKHALASANPENDNWNIYTRTADDIKNGIYRKINAPYDFNIDIEEIDIKVNPWPGIFNSTGTIFEFSCSQEMLKSLIVDKRRKSDLSNCIENLSWDLGYVYSNIILESRISLNIVCDDLGYRAPIKAITPDWIGLYKPKEGTKKITLDGNVVDMDYKFGEVAKHKISEIHYQRNMATSGVEIRLNGRVLEKNLLTEIWGVERHNKYNHFLATIDLKSDNPDYLPKTRTSKNGIRLGDKKLLDLFDWIKGVMKEPPEKTTGEFTEKELINELKKNLESHFINEDIQDFDVSTEREVYRLRKTPVRVDLYEFNGSDIILYEAKKGNADMKSVYQLLMYWDGAVDDNLKPKKGVLVAESFSEGVTSLMKDINNKIDLSGNNYNLECKTWKDYRISLE